MPIFNDNNIYYEAFNLNVTSSKNANDGFIVGNIKGIKWVQRPQIIYFSEPNKKTTSLKKNNNPPKKVRHRKAE